MEWSCRGRVVLLNSRFMGQFISLKFHGIFYNAKSVVDIAQEFHGLFFIALILQVFKKLLFPPAMLKFFTPNSRSVS